MLAVLKVLFVKADADAVVKQQIKVTWKTWMRLACVRDGYVDPFSPYNVLVLTKYTVDCFLFAFLFFFCSEWIVNGSHSETHKKKNILLGSY